MSGSRSHACTSNCLRGLEVAQLEGAERRVRENVDAEDLKIFARQIRQRDDAADERRRGGNAGMLRDGRERLFRQPADGAGDLERRLARDEIDRGGERAIRAVIRDLDREINRDAQRDAQHIQQREQPMPRDVTQHMPAKEAQVGRSHRD